MEDVTMVRLLLGALTVMASVIALFWKRDEMRQRATDARIVAYEVSIEKRLTECEDDRERLSNQLAELTKYTIQKFNAIESSKGPHE